MVLINKVDTAGSDGVARVREDIYAVNPDATVIEDGPTLTHGGMAYGAGVAAARRFGAAELVDPRPYAVGSIAETFKKYPQTGDLPPAMGYGDEQVAELEETINAVDCDLVLVATPFDLRRVLEGAWPMSSQPMM